MGLLLATRSSTGRGGGTPLADRCVAQLRELAGHVGEIGAPCDRFRCWVVPDVGEGEEESPWKRN